LTMDAATAFSKFRESHWCCIRSIKCSWEINRKTYLGFRKQQLTTK
jgi:hypothetical protein